MSKTKKTFDELNTTMTSSLVRMHKLVKKDVIKEDDSIPIANLFTIIIGFTSKVADLSKLVIPTRLKQQVKIFLML